MASRLFSDAEIDLLRGFPEVTPEELIRFFDLEPTDLGFARSFRTDRNRLGVAVQLSVLGWLGFVPGDLAGCPTGIVARLAGQLDVDPAVFDAYSAGRSQTRTDHLRDIVSFVGWRSCGEIETKELDLFLLARAMEHDSPSVLFRLACDYLKGVRVVRPGPVVVVERVAAAREAAKLETFAKVVHLLTPQRCVQLDSMCVVDSALGATRLHWLSHGATTPSPAAVKAEVDKLAYVRSINAHTLDLSMLPMERQRFLAMIGQRSSGRALSRRDPERRYPILLSLLCQTAVDVLDEVVSLFDQAISGRESLARHRLQERLAQRARTLEDGVELLSEILSVVADPDVADEDVGRRLRTAIGMDKLQAAHAAKAVPLPRDHGHLELVNASFNYVRGFAPAVLNAVDFAGGVDAGELIEAVSVLKELYTTGARLVPASAPTSFVPTRWMGYLNTAARDGDTTRFRHYWELCVLLELRDGLRSGDVWVPGSRRYANPSSYLLAPDEWAVERTDFCRLVNKPTAARHALGQLRDELNDAVAGLEAVLDDGSGPVRLDDDGNLIIGRLSAEDKPDGLDALRDVLIDVMPHLAVSAVMVEMDARCKFSAVLTHASGKTSRSDELTTNLFAAIIAQACNIGLAAMSDAAGISYDKLAWTTEWYLREDTLRAANTAVVNYQYQLRFASLWGDGTMSSSDGQRFPTKGHSISARALSRYFVDEGISTYTHVSNTHSTYGTQVIVATQSEATYVLDEILGNLTDLPIKEHTTDTGGVTLVNFALFDLVGLQFSPRIKDIGKISLYRFDRKKDILQRWPHAGPLLTNKVNTALIEDHWDDLLRLAASLKYGRATASLVVGKLSASSRQNAFGSAIKEYGAIRRTIQSALYLSDENRRRRVGRQLNKGESTHALRRSLFFAREGHVRHHHVADQTEQALCLTLLTNLIVAWNTEYLERAVEQRRADGLVIDDELLRHISPASHDHIRFHGSYAIDIHQERAELDTTGYRPLRAAQTARR